MPNRILREGILTSDRVNELGYDSEVFYRRLMSVVDDYGRFDARPVMLKAACYPLRVDRVREADISRWIAICEKAGLIALYAVNGKQYLELADFRQQQRAQPKYPPPSNCPADATQTTSICTAVAHLGGVVVEGGVEDEGERETGSRGALTQPRSTGRKTKVNGSHQAIGTRLPVDWKLPEEWKDWALAVRPDWTPQEVVSVSLEFRDHWLGAAGARGRKADWLATWRNWVRRETRHG